MSVPTRARSTLDGNLVAIAYHGTGLRSYNLNGMEPVETLNDTKKLAPENYTAFNYPRKAKQQIGSLVEAALGSLTVGGYLLAYVPPLCLESSCFFNFRVSWGTAHHSFLHYYRPGDACAEIRLKT